MHLNRMQKALLGFTGFLMFFVSEKTSHNAWQRRLVSAFNNTELLLLIISLDRKTVD